MPYDSPGLPANCLFINSLWKKHLCVLLNEFLKEHRTVQEQEATIGELRADFRATVAQLTARLEAQEAQIQKVRAHLEASKLTLQVVANDQ
jgi:hypothetical protein